MFRLCNSSQTPVWLSQRLRYYTTFSNFCQALFQNFFKFFLKAFCYQLRQLFYYITVFYLCQVKNGSIFYINFIHFAQLEISLSNFPLLVHRQSDNLHRLDNFAVLLVLLQKNSPYIHQSHHAN